MRLSRGRAVLQLLHSDGPDRYDRGRFAARDALGSEGRHVWEVTVDAAATMQRQPIDFERRVICDAIMIVANAFWSPVEPAF